MPKPNLNTILAELDEENIGKKVYLPHSRRREDYPMSKLTIQDYQEFRREIGNYYTHQTGATAPSGNASIARWKAEGDAEDIVENAYARVGGAKGACQMAQKGINGGMKPVIDAIFTAIVRVEEERFVDDILRKHISPLIFPEQIEIAQQFIDQFGKHLSVGKPIKSAMEIAPDYEGIIKFLRENLQFIRTKVRR